MLSWMSCGSWGQRSRARRKPSGVHRPAGPYGPPRVCTWHAVPAAISRNHDVELKFLDAAGSIWSQTTIHPSLSYLGSLDSIVIASVRDARFMPRTASLNFFGPGSRKSRETVTRHWARNNRFRVYNLISSYSEPILSEWNPSPCKHGFCKFWYFWIIGHRATDHRHRRHASWHHLSCFVLRVSASDFPNTECSKKKGRRPIPYSHFSGSMAESKMSMASERVNYFFEYFKKRGKPIYPVFRMCKKRVLDPYYLAISFPILHPVPPESTYCTYSIFY